MSRAPLNDLQEASDSVNRLAIFLRKTKSAQVRSKEEQQVVKATALAWFNNYRTSLASVDRSLFDEVERGFTLLFEYSARATSRKRYHDVLKTLKAALVALQTSTLASPEPLTESLATPNFAPLVTDASMRKILQNRWQEIEKCLRAEAPLAATIMMGGLLEALFLARVNSIEDKSALFRAKAAPRDKKTGKSLPLNQWMLNAFIGVAAEVGWISRPAQDIGNVLRNYRNYVHPEKELSSGQLLTLADAEMFWSISARLAQQILMDTIPKK
jgi:hypothetical protein